MIKVATDNITRIRSYVIQCMTSHWFEKAIKFKQTFFNKLILIDENLLVSNKKTERKDTKMDMPGIEPGVLHMQSKCAATELHSECSVYVIS